MRVISYLRLNIRKLYHGPIRLLADHDFTVRCIQVESIARGYCMVPLIAYCTCTCMLKSGTSNTGKWYMYKGLVLRGSLGVYTTHTMSQPHKENRCVDDITPLLLLCQTYKSDQMVGILSETQSTTEFVRSEGKTALHVSGRRVG